MFHASASFEWYGTWGAIISQWLNNIGSFGALLAHVECLLCGLCTVCHKLISFQGMDAVPHVSQCFISLLKKHSFKSQLPSLILEFWGVKFRWPLRLSRFHVWLWLISEYWFVLLCLPGLRHVVFHQNTMLILERGQYSVTVFYETVSAWSEATMADCFPVFPTMESVWSAQGALSWAICTQWDFPENAVYDESPVAGTSFNFSNLYAQLTHLLS